LDISKQSVIFTSKFFSMGFGKKNDDKKDKKQNDGASKFNMTNNKSIGKTKTKSASGAAPRTRGASRGS
jgi:hypothetical protein